MKDKVVKIEVDGVKVKLRGLVTPFTIMETIEKTVKSNKNENKSTNISNT